MDKKIKSFLIFSFFLFLYFILNLFRYDLLICKFLWKFPLFKISLGFLLLIFSVYFFVLPEEFIVGGLESNLIFLDKFFFYKKSDKKQKYFFSINNNIIIFRILIILIFGFLIGKWDFFISTIIINFIFSMTIKIFDFFKIKRSFILEKLPPIMKENEIYRLSFSALIIGVFLGIGCGLIFANNCSTGGTDVVFLYLQNKLQINLRTILLLTDGLMILVSFFLDFRRKVNTKKNIIVKYIFSLLAFFIAVMLIDYFQK